MLGGTKIKIKKDLWERIKKYAAVAGYSSPEEFVIHVLEKELGVGEHSESDEEIKRKLKGLGYIN